MKSESLGEAMFCDAGGWMLGSGFWVLVTGIWDLSTSIQYPESKEKGHEEPQTDEINRGSNRHRGSV